MEVVFGFVRAIVASLLVIQVGVLAFLGSELVIPVLVVDIFLFLPCLVEYFESTFLINVDL